MLKFNKESDFEDALVAHLQKHGWSDQVIYNPTEKDLIKNWANILFENNRNKDRLNDYPLTDSEMEQILEQIARLRTPLKLNGFINGKTIEIIRDNPEDTQHLGKTISLKIYDRHEIAAGQSRYQIVRQPIFNTIDPLANNRRGDVLLLINGMPVIHIELKKSGIPVIQAFHQINKYSYEGAFRGIFSLVQIFVAMTPEETIYFANPGPESNFNSNYFFHWADFNNEPVNDWTEIARTFLSIPMAHQLIGFYTIADGADGILKIMRSYQYFAANAISDKVSKAQWENGHQLGGFVWHTTGSGKTMTSFKSAQLIASSKHADKVLFLMDRVELGTQSLNEYRNFANENEDVQATENTAELITKLKSNNPANTLIVTSIQKMSNIKGNNQEGWLKQADLQAMQSKRIVFIIDECHRSTFGDMLANIKQTFPSAIFFGFTGTPIHDENKKKDSTTAIVFGDELHRYSIADGIRDKNVLGFDPYMVMTFKDDDLKKAVALDKAKALNEEEAIKDPQKSKIYYKYLELPMAGKKDDTGKYHKGIEDYVPTVQYESKEHQEKVVEDIKSHWLTLSRANKFHAIFATSSIPEAIQYYRLFKNKVPELNVTALFDPNIDNDKINVVINKEEGLKEIIKDYNLKFEQDFSIPTFDAMKKDISSRLAHKKPYERIDKDPSKQINLLIVVDQMLTGFDSKWVNTLYLDKILEYANLIQAFSRTNRLFGEEKPFGTIKYYRKPHTMHQNILDALKLYSGDKPFSLFVQRLNKNINEINHITSQIKDLFKEAGVDDFSKLPEETAEKQQFVKLFNQLNEKLDAAKVQGFNWNQKEYTFEGDDDTDQYKVKVELTENLYKILAQRYKELMTDGPTPPPGGDDTPPYDLKGYLMEIHMDKIDADFMNSKFDKYLKELSLANNDAAAESVIKAREELHKTFAMLNQEEQEAAELFLHDILRGDVIPEEGKTFRDYITEYMIKGKNLQVHRLAITFGLDEDKLIKLMDLKVNENNINEYGRFDDLKATVNRTKAKEYFEKLDSKKLIPPKVTAKIDLFLREFITKGGFDI